MELYRDSTIGKCLIGALDELITNDSISLDLAYEVLSQFDKSISGTLQTEVQDQNYLLKGDLHTYNYVNGVLIMDIRNAQIFNNHKKFPQKRNLKCLVEEAAVVKLVALDSKLKKT